MPSFTSQNPLLPKERGYLVGMLSSQSPADFYLNYGSMIAYEEKYVGGELTTLATIANFSMMGDIPQVLL